MVFPSSFRAFLTCTWVRTGQRPVVDGHVLRQRVHHHLVRLLERHPLLVVPPLDVGKGAAVGGAGRGVHCAQLLAADPCGSEAQELHPVALLVSRGRTSSRS